MRRFIYIGIILAFFGVGFTNLESNEWTPSELPFASNSEKVLPQELWHDILIGKWDFITVFPDNMIYKGTANYNKDSTFIRKLNYTLKTDKADYKAGGTVRGRWQVYAALDEPNPMWRESSSDCNIQPESYSLCKRFESVSYGKLNLDTETHEVLYFNYNRIEIVSTSLATGKRSIYRFTRAK